MQCSGSVKGYYKQKQIGSEPVVKHKHRHMSHENTHRMTGGLYETLHPQLSKTKKEQISAMAVNALQLPKYTKR